MCCMDYTRNVQITQLKFQQFGTYLPITLEFCELFSQLHLRAEPLVHPRGLQTFQKTLWRPNEWQKLYLFNPNPNPGRKPQETERNTRPQYDKVSVSAREKMRTLILRHACPLQSIDPRIYCFDVIFPILLPLFCISAHKLPN